MSSMINYGTDVVPMIGRGALNPQVHPWVQALNIDIAKSASSEDQARNTWTREGYSLPMQGTVNPEEWDREVARRGFPTNGFGYFDITLSVGGEDRRLIYHGPGEYIIPSWHEAGVQFHVTSGSAHLWIWNNFQYTWEYVFKKKSDTIEIGAKVIHCLIAGDYGLSMHTPKLNDNPIAFIEYEMTPPEAFCRTLESIRINYPIERNLEEPIFWSARGLSPHSYRTTYVAQRSI
ncbi:MAG: hypothetical protein WCF65_09510 [Parachlamydiaceae bacterium]